VALNGRTMGNDVGVRRRGLFEGSVKTLSGIRGRACHVNGLFSGIRKWEL
jgi:hypothetical protein